MRINERVMGECTFDEWVLCAFFGDKAITPVANNVQGPSFKLILKFLRNEVHLVLIFKNIRVGKETYAI